MKVEPYVYSDEHDSDPYVSATPKTIQGRGLVDYITTNIKIIGGFSKDEPEKDIQSYPLDELTVL